MTKPGFAELTGLCDRFGWGVQISLGRRRPDLEAHDQVLEVRDMRNEVVLAEPVPAEESINRAAGRAIIRLAKIRAGQRAK